jgi:hypothetical protein
MRGLTARPNNESPKNASANTTRSNPNPRPPKKRQRRSTLQPRVGRTTVDLPWDQRHNTPNRNAVPPISSCPSAPKQHASARTKKLHIPDLPTFRPSDLPTFRLSDFPTFRLSDLPTFRLSDFPTFRLSDFPTFRLSDSPSQRDDSIGAHDFNRGLTPPIKTNRIPTGASSSRQGSQPVAGGS